MFTEELSGPTHPALGSCCRVPGLSPAWLLEFAEVFLLGGRRRGYSYFTSGLVCPKRGPLLPLSASSPAKDNTSDHAQQN